jgi:hypothetical protein
MGFSTVLKKEKGAALLMALFISIFISIITTLMMEELYRSFRISTVMLKMEDNLSTLYSLDAVGHSRLVAQPYRPKTKAPLYHLPDTSSQQKHAEGRILDLQGLFNVANLFYDKAPDTLYFNALLKILYSISQSHEGQKLLNSEVVPVVAKKIQGYIVPLVKSRPKDYPMILPPLNEICKTLDLSSELAGLLEKWLTVLPLLKTPSTINVQVAPIFLLKSVLGLSSGAAEQLRQESNGPLPSPLVGRYTAFVALDNRVNTDPAMVLHSIFWLKDKHTPVLLQRILKGQ